MHQRDPLDIGALGPKQWEEFRARYASALVLKWLVRDLSHFRPQYVGELAARLESAGIDFDKSLEYSGDDEESLPITGPVWPEDMRVIEWVSRRELQLLTAALFPHGHRNTNLPETIRGAVVLGLHGALEAYATALSAHSRGNLVDSIKKFLRGRGSDLDSKTADALATADATRHVLVHRAGIVDQGYLRQAKSPQFQLGESRRISSEELESWSVAFYRAAEQLRFLGSAPPAV